LFFLFFFFLLSSSFFLLVSSSSPLQDARSKSGSLETKEEVLAGMNNELLELRSFKRRKEKEELVSTSEVVSGVALVPGASATKESGEESKEFGGMSMIDGSSSAHEDSVGLKRQLKATLGECSMLRSEVQKMRMAIHEKDFRLQALREIVGGLEKMVPSDGVSMTF
jgi:hypothetical protein